MRRLKSLLPHSEVTSTCQDNTSKLPMSIMGKSKGGSARQSSRGHCEGGDGWSTGDESINEFPSSEEQLSAENTTFSHSLPAAIALPSLISMKQSQTSPPPSAESGTYGSLHQSPIDLSLDECSGESTPHGSTPTYHSRDQSTQVPDRDNKQKQDHLGEVDEDEGEGGDKDALEQMRTVQKKRTASNSRNLKDGDSLPIQANPSTNTPPSKRLRLCDSRGSEPRRLFSSRQEKDGQTEMLYTTDPTSEDFASHTTPVFIDLTQDEEDSDSDTPQQTPNGTVQKPIDLSDVHLNTDHSVDPGKDKLIHPNTASVAACPPCLPEPAVVIELSDSQSTGSSMGPPSSQQSASLESGSGCDLLGSPSCLPPTPGRENVHSILQRKDFIFT